MTNPVRNAQTTALLNGSGANAGDASDLFLSGYRDEGGNPPGCPWILETGFWNDAGCWDDSATWNDGVAPPVGVTFDPSQSNKVILSASDLQAQSNYDPSGFPFPTPVIAASTEFELGAQGIESTFTIDLFNGLGDGFSILVSDSSFNFGLLLSSDGVFQNDLTGNDSASIAPLSAGDIVTIIIRETGNVYFGVNGVFYSWDGVAGSTPVANGDPATDSNPTLTGFTGSTGNYFVSSNGLGDVTTWTITAAFNI